MTLPTFSLDTPRCGSESLHSGHNFREVAPELLSPMTWSVVGAGMERGFRDAAAFFGREQVKRARPHFVSYLGFRPFFNMTTVERLADELPVVDPADIWELLLGGPGPMIQRSPRPGRFHRARRLSGGLAFLRDNARAFEKASCALARAEQSTLTAMGSGSVWQLGSACDDAVRAGRLAWALHIRTTCVAFVASAVAKETFGLRYDEATSFQLLRACAHRSHEKGGSIEVGPLDEHTDRINNYEVADRTEAFAPFTSRSLSAAASMLNQAPPRAPGDEMAVDVPYGTAMGPVFDAAVDFMGLALGERERSKGIGLRALHCIRLLLDQEAFGVEAETAALLGVDELRGLAPQDARKLAAARTQELREAAQVGYPVDISYTARGVAALRRPVPRDGHGRGLAGGWATGVLSQESDGEPGIILVGDRVDGNYVLAVLPDGVVTRYGSVLSHVAIVCRELGIPLLAGVDVPEVQLGRRATLDGWAGTLDLAGQRESPR